MARNKVNQHQAFTLIEVIFAVVILAGSLVVLLGLQSAAVSKALRDRYQLQAMMAARHILASLEVQQDSSPRTLNDSVYGMLEDLQALPYPDPELEDLYREMDVELVIQEWPNPPEIALLAGDKNLLNRILLKIFWGEDTDDHLEVIYFIPNTSV